MTISLYANGYSNGQQEAALVTQTASTADFTNVHTTINHVSYKITDTEAPNVGFMIYISSVSFSFSC